MTPPATNASTTTGAWSVRTASISLRISGIRSTSRFTSGTWGSANSSIEAWVAPYGQPMLKWINTNNYIMQTKVFATPAHGQEICLVPATTCSNSRSFRPGRSPGRGPAAHVWYDELIVSSQPIAQPGGRRLRHLHPLPHGTDIFISKNGIVK